MALWTPYKQEEAIDPSKHAASGERESPLSTSSSALQPRPLSALYLSEPEVYRNSFHYISSYTYPQAAQAVSFGMSPNLIGSCFNSHGIAPSPPTATAESLHEDLEYQVFERDALRAMADRNGGSILGNNPRMRRAVQSNRTADDCDDSYRQQRLKNNFAAKQSRERRKLREVRLALQVTYLKKKVAELRARQICGRCGQGYK